MIQTEILRAEDLDRALARTREVLLSGGLVAFPTETVYGLGGNALDASASRKIYAAKGRPSDNPLIVHVGSVEDVKPLVREIPEKAKALMDAFWPGPLTIILPKSGLVPMETTGGLQTVALRMPSHSFANAMLRNCGCPVAAPSANRSGRPSTTRFSHVLEDLQGRVDLIIDAGDVPIGVESTIIDLTGEAPTLLRPGKITIEELASVIGPIQTDPAILSENIIAHKELVSRPKAPGMKYRHYAPRAEMWIVSGETEDVAETVNELADERTGILTVDEHQDLYRCGKILSVGSLRSPMSIAHNLFACLRDFDTMGVTRIYSEDFSEADIGTAIMNRLLKAAGGNEVQAEELLKRTSETDRK